PIASPSPSPNPSATATVTATPTCSGNGGAFWGTVSYCSNPGAARVPDVTIQRNGVPLATTDCYGIYRVSQPVGTGIITPFKARETPGSPGINTIDVVAVQRH